MWLFASIIEHTSNLLDIALDIPDVIKLFTLIRQGWKYIKSIFNTILENHT